MSSTRRLLPSRRAMAASDAVVERIVAKYLRPGVINLAPGTAHWSAELHSELMPPLADAASFPRWSRYGAVHGSEALLSALREKLETENGHDMAAGTREVMVTNGANQAYAAALLATCDPGDEVVLFRPYYFSHLVAVQLLGLVPRVIDCDALGQPDVAALRCVLASSPHIRAVTLVSPSNPSGICCNTRTRQELLSACQGAGAWLISDEAYEHFVYGGEPHVSPAAASTTPSDAADDSVISLYTFSKSFGLAGWRVGYMSYPIQLHDPLLKVQDTLPTHATLYSQELARRALTQLGTPWVRHHVASLGLARSQLWTKVQPLHQHRELEVAATLRDGGGATEALTPPVQPAGAFYYMLPLPNGLDEERAIAVLAQQHGLLVLPGSAFGAPGSLRLSYGLLADAVEVDEAATRLAAGVQSLLHST